MPRTSHSHTGHYSRSRKLPCADLIESCASYGYAARHSIRATGTLQLFQLLSSGLARLVHHFAAPVVRLVPRAVPNT
jgi:hypothetical protein